ncbi:MAG TPA: hypothetical protein VHF25_01725 [Nitriliruptorales bacterium]|nr:hypothetical protein [Nitriliruptorales bacterium]
MASDARAGDVRVIHISAEAVTWTPAQILALVLGVAYIVLGGVALLRTGVGSSVFEPTTQVAGLAYTPLLGMVEVIYGLLLLALGAFPRAAQGVVFMGVLALAFGLLLVIEPGAFRASIAAGRAHGWFYVLTGGSAAVVGMLTPVLLRRRAHAYVRDLDLDDEVLRRPQAPAAASTDRPSTAPRRASTSAQTRRIDLSEDEERHTTRMRR